MSSKSSSSNRPLSLTLNSQKVKQGAAVTATTTTNVIFNNGHNNTHDKKPQVTSRPSTPSIPSSRKKTEINKIKIKNFKKDFDTEETTTDEDIDIQALEELNFLYLIYVPNKYLIKNNKKSIKNLLIHLPKIYEPSTKVNLSIHLFLSTIMIKYVNSWYLNKLNTSNLTFVKNTYSLIIQLIKDIINRISSVNIIQMLDQLVHVLNRHLLDTCPTSQDTKYPYRFISEYYEKCDQLNNLSNDPSISPKDIINNYLASQHVMYQTDTLNYYRILIKKMLQSSTSYANSDESALFSSKIASDLVMLILSDIVIKKVVEKLSSQEFMFDKEKRSEEVSVSWSQKIQKVVYGTYKNITKLVLVLSYNNPGEEPSKNDVLNNSVFELLETILNLQDRKPFLYNLMSSFKSLIQINQKLNTLINKFVSKFVHDKVNQALSNENKLSKIINDLRLSLFYGNDNNDSDDEKQEVTIDELTDKFIKINDKFIKSFIDLSYNTEDTQRLRDSIKSVLMIFQQNSEFSDIRINQILIVQWLDVIISNLYPDI
ncbi:hypothetical protein SBY92_005226 [Candida maltosa Xu316]